MGVNDILNLKRHRNFVESTQIGGIIVPIIKIYQYKTYLYGGGRDTRTYLDYFERNGVEIEGIIDRDKRKKGTLIKNIPYIMVDELKEVITEPEKVFIIITTHYWNDIGTIEGIHENVEISSALLRLGIKNIYSLNGMDKTEMTAELFGWVQYYYDHADELENTLNKLYDKESKDAFIEYLKCVVLCEPYSLKHHDGRYKYFYGSDDNNKTDLYKHLDDEVWLNCGSSIGDSIFLYWANGLSAKRIFAYECNPAAYSRLCFNLEYLPDKYQKKVTPVEECICYGTNFDWIKERITLINADIEGNEMSMLHAMESRIQSDRPVVAVCVYHKAEDLVEIPRLLSNALPDSKLILRKYESWIKHSLRKDELVLYAIPNERLVDI